MEYRNWIGVTVVVGAILTLVGVLYKPTEALPTFAKAYGESCQVCHTTVPQLNAYGRYVQRTGYAALERSVLNGSTPFTLSESANGDTGSAPPGKTQMGNLALHLTGYAAPDITYHVHQWFAQHDQSGGLDTLQVAYSNLFKHYGHLFVGKLSNLPVPGPFSNQSDLAPYATSEMMVGEHMYMLDMMRWGTELTYVRPTFFAGAAWLGSNADLNGATDFSANNDKTFQWIAALAGPDKPLEVGAFGTVGSFPLSEGGVDLYNSQALFVQKDPQDHLPGVYALYQWTHDGNPGMPSSSMGGAMMPLPPSHGHGWLAEVYQPVLTNRAIVGVREEMTDDGLGMIAHSGNIDLALQPMRNYPYFHTHVEAKLNYGSGPTWAWSLWWSTPIGGKL
jgi:hypothetical protein